jgi:hypothetical protein
MNFHQIKKRILSLNPLVVFYYFALTVIVVRSTILLALLFDRIPGIHIRGLHFHHFGFGFIFLAWAIWESDINRYPRVILEVLYGISLGLIFDEFVYWTFREFNYWSAINLWAVIILGSITAVLSLLHPRPFAIQIHHKSRHKFKFYKHLFIPWSSFVVIVVVLFRLY